MIRLKPFRIYFIIFLATSLFAEAASGQDISKSVTVRWSNGTVSGKVNIINGQLTSLGSSTKKRAVKNGNFKVPDARSDGLSLTVGNATLSEGPDATMVCIETDKGPFSFFLRDVQSGYPIWIPEYGVTVLPSDDMRTYEEVAAEISGRGYISKIAKIESQPEISFETIKDEVRDMSVPVWLGVSRDIRLFEIAEELGDTNNEDKVIRPKLFYNGIYADGFENGPIFYRYALGRGVGPYKNIRRWLENGTLPIYHSEMTDDDVVYHTVSFASFEMSELKNENIEGTDFMISDYYGAGRVFTGEQKIKLDSILGATAPYTEELVLYIHTEIENTGSVPRYAWIKAPRPGSGGISYDFDRTNGFSRYSPERVFCVSKLNGQAMAGEETAVLLMPGEKAVYEMYIPHMPVGGQRAEQLITRDFNELFERCKSYWNGRLNEAAEIKVPETRINEMIKAGLLHLQLVTFGKEPDGPLAANVGIYTPIGTESSPIIQFYASMGLNDLARRSLEYFLETQQPDGRIENYSGYTIETGAFLWCTGEYYRYTRDDNWVLSVKDKLLKACEYLTAWRNRSKAESLRGRGYGMIDGKVADPEDHFHQFMLNGYGYMGMSRIAEAFEKTDTVLSAVLRKEAEEWREDIRATLFNTMSLSPAVPLGNGAWSPTIPPWAEAYGPRSLYAEPQNSWTHGSFILTDALLGPLYLIFCEVLDPYESASEMLFNYNSELFLQNNSAFSQPYYSRHNWVQIRRGMVKPFLNTYYSTMAAHADRSTYSFWEHMYKQSPHKTHEEANFLMETRWMLYMEEGEALHLFRVAPRKWFEDGKEIKLSGVRSYFGGINAYVISAVGKGSIKAVVECTDKERRPEKLTVRLPHPDGRKPERVTGGVYDPVTETVTIDAFEGRANINLEY